MDNLRAFITDIALLASPLAWMAVLLSRVPWGSIIEPHPWIALLGIMALRVMIGQFVAPLLLISKWSKMLVALTTAMDVMFVHFVETSTGNATHVGRWQPFIAMAMLSSPPILGESDCVYSYIRWTCAWVASVILFGSLQCAVVAPFVPMLSKVLNRLLRGLRQWSGETKFDMWLYGLLPSLIIVWRALSDH